MSILLAPRTAAFLALAGLGFATSALADDKVAKIGILNDMSSVYADAGGPGSVLAAKMAIADFTAAHIGTMYSATCSGVSSVIGSSPGNTLARMRVRIGPGWNRLTRIGVIAVSCAHTRTKVSSAAFDAE